MKAEIAQREMILFVAPAEVHSNLDGDEIPAMRACLQIVQDYLDWLKAQGHL